MRKIISFSSFLTLLFILMSFDAFAGNYSVIVNDAQSVTSERGYIAGTYHSNNSRNISLTGADLNIGGLEIGGTATITGERVRVGGDYYPTPGSRYYGTSNIGLPDPRNNGLSTIVVPSGDYTVPANTTIHQWIYCPNGTVYLHGERITIHGGIVARSISITGQEVRINGAFNPSIATPTPIPSPTPIPDNTPPTISYRNYFDTQDFTSRNWDRTTVMVRLKFSDYGGSGFKNSRYNWSTSGNYPHYGWSGYNWGNNYLAYGTSDGVWYLHVEAWDNAGNRAYRVAGPYRIDTIPPTPPTINANSNWTNSQVPVSISGGSDSLSGVNRIEYALMGASSKGWDRYNSQFNIQNQGETRIYARTYDNVGNYSNWVMKPVRIDYQNPTISFRNNSDTSNYTSQNWTDQSVLVRLKFSDSGGSSYKNSRYVWSTSNSEPHDGWSGVTSSGNYVVTQGSEGIWYLHTRAWDNAGNYQYALAGPYRIDKTDPMVLFRNDPDNANFTSSNWGNESVTVRIKLSDTGGSGYKNSKYLWSNSNSAPQNGWSNYVSSNNYRVAQGSNGIWYLHVLAWDNAGNYEYSMAGPYRIDKSSPTISFRNNSDTENYTSQYWYNQSVRVRLKFADVGESGYKNSKYVWSTSNTAPQNGWSNYASNSNYIVTQSTEGIWYLHVLAWDNAGNYKSRKAGPYRIDKTSPTPPTINANTNWTNATSVPATIQGGTDSLSGVNRREYKLSGSTTADWSNYIARFNISNEGLTTISARTVDNAGNYSIPVSLKVRIDRTKPVSEVSHYELSPLTYYGMNEWTNKNIRVYIRGSDVYSGVNKLQWSSNSVNWHDINSPVWEKQGSTEWWYYTYISEGTWTRYYRVTDHAGNISDINNYNVKIDKTGPNAGVGNSIYYTNKNNNQKIRFSTEGARDVGNFKSGIRGVTWSGFRIGVESTWYHINVEGTISSNVNQVINNFVDIDVRGEGTYYYRAIAYDNANNGRPTTYTNHGVPAVAQVMVDRTPPSNPQINTNTSWTNENSVRVTINPGVDSNSPNIPHSASGVDKTEYRLSGATNTNWTNYTVPFNITNEGITTIEVRTYDRATNYSTQTAQVKIDRTAPTVQFSPNGNNNLIENQEFNIIVTFSDQVGLSGVDESTLQYAWVRDNNSTLPTDGWNALTNGINLSRKEIGGDFYLWVKGFDIAGNPYNECSNLFKVIMDKNVN